jgi:GT2 family glycosyltransferase
MECIWTNTNNYSIIWVDDASSEGSIEKVQEFLEEQSIPYELIVKKHNTGFAQSVNLGLARALEIGSEYIVIQNNDTEVFAGWLDRMIAVAERESRIGAVGPITSPCESWQSVIHLPQEFDQFSNLPEYDGNPEAYAQLIAERYKNQHLVVKKRLAFFSVLLKANIVKEVGMLSEEYGVGFGEDDDYMLRLRLKGYFGALAKDVFVFHNHNTTFRGKYSLEEIEEMREKNRDFLYRKFGKGRYRPKDPEQIWDIEEAIAYIKQIECQLEKKKKEVEQIKKQQKEQIDKKNNELTEKNAQIGNLKNSLQKSERQIKKLNADLEDLDRCRKNLDDLYNSFSWRITLPFRNLKKLMKK